MKTIDGLDGNGLLKRYALSMEDKMAAGSFGRARNYGEAVPLMFSSECYDLIRTELRIQKVFPVRSPSGKSII